MNEKLQYASMLEMPVNSVNVTVKPAKKKKLKLKRGDSESVKQRLIDKVNSQMPSERIPCEQSEDLRPLDVVGQTNVVDNRVQDEDCTTKEFAEQSDALTQRLDIEEEQGDSKDDYLQEREDGNTASDLAVSIVKGSVTPKQKRFSFGVVGVQLMVIGVLIATIFLTNAFYEDSGINTFMKSVFGGYEQSLVDTRQYNAFSPVIKLADGDYVLQDGVLNINVTGSVYSSCDGKVSSITVDKDGKYTLVVAHSENFKSVFTGLDYAYVGLNDGVYGSIPVGYVGDTGATMCFTDSNGAVITDYQIIDEAVVWQV